MRKITTLFALLLMAVIGASAANVAKIGTTEYATFEAAWNAVQDGETITLLADCNGNGLKTSAAGKFTTGITVDFAGHTYTVDGNLVGSTGTETQAFQLLQNNTITFKNGTIYSEKAKFLVQNYSNLTLENMTLTLNNPDYTSAYTLSNNNGEVVIDGTTINANPAGGVAFDVCRYASYPSVSVTVTGDSYINGDIEVSASGSSAGDGMTLNLQSGTLNGDLDIQASAQTAIANSPEKTNIATTDDIAANDNFSQTHHVAKIGDQGYETLAQAIAAVPENTQTTINLIANTTENVTIPAGKNIVLNFNDGVILDGGSYFGTPQHKTAAITNLGTVEIEGNGIIKRRDVAKANGDGQAAYYVILNNGTMTISDVTVVNNSGPSNPDGVWSGASLIANGTKAPAATLTIESGTFTQNNFNVIKNDDYGTLIINGGTFNSTMQQVLQNWNNTTINDGEFNGEIASWAWEGNGAQANPTVTISGGDFNNSVIGTYFDGNVTTNSPSISITNGTFNDCEFNESDNSEIAVSGGSFSDIVPLNVCAENYIPVTTTDPSTGMYTVGQGKVIEDGVAYNNATMGTGNDEVDLVYTRTFTEDMVGKYQCFMVPFSIIESEIPEGVTLYGIYGGATGVEAGNTVAITEIRAYDCNLPAVIKVDRAGTYNFFVNSNIIGDPYSLQVDADNYDITVTGTYDFTTANALNEWASLNTDGQLIWSYKGDTVKPYRWILKATDKNGNSAPIHNLKFVEVDNAGIDTGISTINAVSSDSEVEAIYSANGQRLQSMQKGINIIRMKDNTVKKVIIK